MRLSQMATNVLNLNKVESQTILTDIQTYNLSEQLRTSVLVLEGKWTRKHIEIMLPEEEYQLTGNMDLLNQVWINLLDNAIKFSAEYSVVEVRVRQDEASTAVEISNFCKDIPPEKLDKIFSKFYQADESHAAEGNGIGLAVVKKVVDLHNGSLKVISDGGKTTFRVTLPRQ